MDILLKQEEELYPSVIESLTTEKKYSADKLNFKELDDWRNIELPAVLAKRYYGKTKEIWLTKEELIKLMDWKLMKGKFRPTLPKLIKSNDQEAVLDITREGFSIFLTKTDNYEANLKKALNKLCELRGVGPATSTLMISLLNKIDGFITPPFFSDESFYWFNPEFGKLKYTLKEYFESYLQKYLALKIKDNDLNKIERATWSIYKQSELNPEFKIDPIFLQNYDTYIQQK